MLLVVAVNFVHLSVQRARDGGKEKIEAWQESLSAHQRLAAVRAGTEEKLRLLLVLSHAGPALACAAGLLAGFFGPAF